MHSKALLLSLLPAVALASPRVAGRAVTCTFSIAASAGDTCDSFCASWSISLATFKSLNPGVQCPALEGGKEYCVDGSVTTGGPTTSPPPTSTKPPPTSTKPPPTTTSSPSAPSPTQSGLAGNCDRFHKVVDGDVCGAIERTYGMTAAQFNAWNPAVNSDCTNLWLGYFVCVHVPGATPPTTTTTTTPSNGIQTPQPTQPGMVTNCNKFHYIYPDNTCGQITSFENISQEDFAKWNPHIGPDCHGLQANANACVGVIGGGTPTTTAPPSGVQTPQPTQPGMVKNCVRFHYIYPDNTCGQITSFENISQHDFATWNPQVGEDCRGLWANAYACVAVK